MRTYDKAKLRAGGAARGAALGFVAIAVVLAGGYSMLQCSRDKGTPAAVTKPAPKPAIKKAPTQKKKAPPAKAIVTYDPAVFDWQAVERWKY